MVSLHVDASPEQTMRVMQAAGRKAAGGETPLDHQRLATWHQYQRQLAEVMCLDDRRREIVVPFGEKLATKVRFSAKRESTRLRRDYHQVLKAIMTHALLHHDQRDKNRDGAIIANVEQDYANVYGLMSGWFAHSTGIGMSALMRETVEAVRYLQKASSGVTIVMVGDYLSIHKSTALRRLREAVERGFVTNLETHPNRAGQYRVADDAEVGASLPTVEEL
jgi:hypothetical protein